MIRYIHFVLFINIVNCFGTPILAKPVIHSLKSPLLIYKDINTSVTDEEIKECASAIVGFTLKLNQLSDTDICELKTIYSNINFNDSQKYAAMANDKELYELRNYVDYYYSILIKNNFKSHISANAVPSLYIETYINKLGIPNVGTTNCTAYKSAIKACIEDQAICCAMCAFGGLTPATGACLIYCGWQALRCGNNAEANYPDCAGIKIKPIFNESFSSNCQ